MARSIFGDNFARSRDIVTVDFGCGPLTWGVAMAWYYLALEGQAEPQERLRLRYIGVEQSMGAIRRAKAMHKYRRLFAEDSEILFATDVEEPAIIGQIGKYAQESGSDNPLIVLNFAFLFASETLHVPTFVKVVKKILEQYAQHTICLTFQNPPLPGLNIRWGVFKKAFPELHTLYANSCRDSDCVYYVDTTGRRVFWENNAWLYYEVLSNRPLAALVGGGGA